MNKPSPASFTSARQEQHAETARPGPAKGAAARLRAWWSALAGVIGAVVGLAPHVLHHIGLLAGTALITGAGGTALFGVLGLVASVPLLLRLRRRFGTWRAPGGRPGRVRRDVLAVRVRHRPCHNSGGGPSGGGQPSPSIDHSGHHN